MMDRGVESEEDIAWCKAEQKRVEKNPALRGKFILLGHNQTFIVSHTLRIEYIAGMSSSVTGIEPSATGKSCRSDLHTGPRYLTSFSVMNSECGSNTNNNRQALNSAYQHHPDTLLQPHSFPVLAHPVRLVQYACLGLDMFVAEGIGLRIGS